MYWRVQCSAR
ncbi:hypothetical protein GQ600_15981 [Phytophthora cactorum]|nr:hypothetical protein GQ600_15981 [Phytophthora cactorum]